MLTDDQLSLLISPDYMLERILEVQRYVFKKIRISHERAFRRNRIGSKVMAVVDLLAEEFMTDLLETRFGDEVLVLGEESLEKDPDLTFETRTCVLLDVIDGTDLLERDFSNWCSAVTVFTPLDRRIDATFVGVRGQRSSWLYFTNGRQRASKLRLSEVAVGSKPLQLRGPSNTTMIEDSSICMYAQKSSGLNAAVTRFSNERAQKFISRLADLSKERKQSGDELGFRFYDLAGNPMMTRLADRVIDVVVGIHGQKAHDVVPGAIIALRAGAALWDLESPGRILNESDLAHQLLRPNLSKMRYVLAANSSLAEQITALVGGE